MLDRQGFAHYSTPVGPVMKSVRGRPSDTSLTENLTENYNIPVRSKALFVKGLSLTLQKLHKYNSICASKFLGCLWR